MNNDPEHPIYAFFRNGIDLSNFNIFNYTQCRGDIEGQVITTASEVITQIYSAVQFSPHAVTHFDLPWCLDEHELALAEGYEGVGTIPSPKSEGDMIRITQLMDHYSEVKVIDTIILDLSYKVNEIKKYIDQKSGYFFQKLKPPHFETMMQCLEIKKKIF